MFPVFFDTCVLLKPYLCDTVLSIAERGLYRPMWSTDVLAELERQVSRYRREPRTVGDLLDVLGSAGHGCPRFAAACREFL